MTQVVICHWLDMKSHDDREAKMKTLPLNQLGMSKRRARHDGKLLIFDGNFWAICGAVVGLVGGTFFPIFGAILTAASWMIDDGALANVVGRVGAWLLYVTIPLLILSGFCLDRLEADSKKRNR